MGGTRSRISTDDLFKIVSRTWSNAGLEGCTASPGRDTNTRRSCWSRPCDHAATSFSSFFFLGGEEDMPVVVQRQVPGQWIRLSVSSGSSCVSPRRLLGEFWIRARAVRTWKLGALFRRGLVPGRHASVSGCCLEEYSTLDPLGDVFSRAQCLARQWIQVMQSGYYREEDDFSYVRNARLHSGYMLCYGTPGFWTNFEVFPIRYGLGS